MIFSPVANFAQQALECSEFHDITTRIPIRNADGFAHLVYEPVKKCKVIRFYIFFVFFELRLVKGVT